MACCLASKENFTPNKLERFINVNYKNEEFALNVFPIFFFRIRGMDGSEIFKNINPEICSRPEKSSEMTRVTQTSSGPVSETVSVPKQFPTFSLIPNPCVSF
jgi:hypothetical protein